jgi:hemin uptake protein HemP
MEPERAVPSAGAAVAGDVAGDVAGAMTGRAPAPAAEPEPVPVATLLQGRRELHIAHAGAVYRLRLTANNKLILTK